MENLHDQPTIDANPFQLLTDHFSHDHRFSELRSCAARKSRAAPLKKIHEPHWKDGQLVVMFAGLYMFWVDNRRHCILSTSATVREQMSNWRHSVNFPSYGSRYTEFVDFMEDDEKRRWCAEGNIDYLRDRIATCERELTHLPTVVRAARKRYDQRTTSWRHEDFHGPKCSHLCPAVQLHQQDNLRMGTEYLAEVDEYRELEEVYKKELVVLRSVLAEEHATLKSCPGGKNSKKRIVLDIE